MTQKKEEYDQGDVAGTTTDLETTVRAFCRHATELLGNAAPPRVRKWIRRDGALRLEEVLDTALQGPLISFGVMDILRRFQSYKGFADAISEHRVLSTAPQRVGTWGRPDQIIGRMLREAIQVSDVAWRVDPAKAIASLHRIIDLLTADEIEYRAVARVLGLELNVREVVLDSALRLVRLTDEEMNAKQPPADAIAMLGWRPPDLISHHAELRAEVTVANADFFDGQNEARRQTSKMLEDAVAALRLFRGGLIDLGPKELQSDLAPAGLAFSLHAPDVFSASMRLTQNDADGLRRAYNIVRSIESTDRLLGRAVHHFLNGRKRPNPIDQIVDYAVAWESILLTTNGNPERQELGYRFSLNGASVLHSIRSALDRYEGYSKMKCAYDARSAIVHGSDLGDIQKKVRKVGFDSTTSLANFLEAQFRSAVFWLAQMDAAERPYRKVNGWLTLLWGT